MRVANTPEMDSLPPPYTEVPDASDAARQPVQASLRGGYMRPDQNNSPSTTMPFENRDIADLHGAAPRLSLLEHTIHFNVETTRDDLAFPLPIEAYVGRDVSSRDWSTFVNFLFPRHDQVRNEKLMPEKEPQRLSFVGEDTPARRDRILAAVAEWNENFFEPRRIRVNVDFSPMPSYASSRSAAPPSVVQTPYPGSHPPPPARPNTHGDVPFQRSDKPSAPQPIHRSSSVSSKLSSTYSVSSSSSSSLSVDSIKSKDIEGADLGHIRSALRSFQMSATKDHLRVSVRQLRDDIRSQRKDTRKDSKELKKEYKNQRKEIKKEIKAIVKQVKATRKADRKIRKAERKSRREGRRAEHRGGNRIQSLQERGQRAEERAAERVLLAHERGREVEGYASERVARAHEKAREAQAQGATAVARAQERAADARTRGRFSEGVAIRRRERSGNDGEQESGVVLRED